MLTHASLFSGIGGFDLAAEWAGWENIFHCEWNPFGQKVLAHHFPNSKSYHDITKTDFSIHEGTVDVITGGFPCQPYSWLEKDLGKPTKDTSFLKCLERLKKSNPDGSLARTFVDLLVGMKGWSSTRCTMTWKGKDMKSNRFLFQLQVSAHRTNDIGFGLLPTPKTLDNHNQRPLVNGKNISQTTGTSYGIHLVQLAQAGMLPTPIAGDWKGQLRKDGNRNTLSGKMALWAKKMLPTPSAFDWNTAQTQEKYQERKQMQKEKGINLHYPLKQMAMDINPSGKTSQVASPICGGDDGLPKELDGITFSKWRNESIKAYGNAIVPQVAYQIFKAINEFELLVK